MRRSSTSASDRSNMQKLSLLFSWATLLLLCHHVDIGWSHSHVAKTFLGSKSLHSKDPMKLAQPMRFRKNVKVEEVVEEGKKRSKQTSTLIASPAEIDPRGETVTLQWSGIKYQRGDFIAVWCPPEEIPNGEVSFGTALDMMEVKSDNYTLDFPFLINMRCEYIFRYITLDGQSWDPAGMYTIVAESNIVTVKGGLLQPTQGHIAITNKLDEMSVTWITGGNASMIGESVVEYGLEEDDLIFTTLSQPVTTYTIDDLCGRPANIPIQPFFRDPGLIHHVMLKGLKPSTRYYYKYGSNTTGIQHENTTSDGLKGWSEVHSFVTRSAPNPNANTSLVFYGDLASDIFPRAAGTIQGALNEKKLDAVLHAGDLSYSMGFAWMWEWFFTVIEPLAVKVPYMVSVGNHEYDETSTKHPTWHPTWGNYGDDSGGECGVPVQKKFKTPGNGKFWYSFDYGNIHITMMSTEHDYEPKSEQYNWLVNDLSSVDRSKTPFIILTGHRPMYTSTEDKGETSVAAHLREYLEPLLMKYHVQVCLWGHIHLYERSCPVFNSTCQDASRQNAPVHLTVGSAGADLTFPDSFQPWSVAHVVNWGYLKIESNPSSMRLQFKLNSNGTVLDDLWIQPW